MEKDAAAIDTLEPRRSIVLKSSITRDVILSKVAIPPMLKFLSKPDIGISAYKLYLQACLQAIPRDLRTQKKRET